MNQCFVGDSGCLLYTKKGGGKKPGPQMREIGDWTNLCTDGVVGGTTIRDFADYLSRKRGEQAHYLIPGITGAPKFPDSWTVSVYANLNDIFGKNGKYVGKGAVFDSELADLCEEMQYYVSPLMVCTARHFRWGIKDENYNIVAKDVRNRCRLAGIAVKQGREFWETVRPWATMMGGMHHYDGGWKSLAWCWDRAFFCVRACSRSPAWKIGTS
jgi:hypothetical protein